VGGVRQALLAARDHAAAVHTIHQRHTRSAARMVIAIFFSAPMSISFDSIRDAQQRAFARALNFSSRNRCSAR
jgi:hypothetical protein